MRNCAFFVSYGPFACDWRDALFAYEKKKPRPQAIPPQIFRFAVVGDSHVGFGSSLSIFRGVLQKAVGSGNKRYVIFGGDNAHAGADHGNFAQARYTDFKNTVTSVLGSKNIAYKASIGNWETTTRTLFTQYLGSTTGQNYFPGTQGKVRHIWLDNATGQFSAASIKLLKSLDSNHYYIVDFHWPLNIAGFTADPAHVLTQAETDRFFKAIPAAARNNVLAIFTHHAHKFYQKLTDIYSGFPNTKFFVTGCSGDYESLPSDRGYYDATLTIQNNQYSLEANAVIV